MRLAPAAVALVAAGVLALTSSIGDDYANVGCKVAGLTCDDPAAAIGALAEGDFDTFFADQPFIGPVSVVLRVPAAWIAGSDLLTEWRLGALLCLLGAAGLGIALAAVSAQFGRPLWWQVAIAALAVALPTTRASLAAGHPEELLTAALAVGGLVTALRGHSLAGVALLGAAIATKAWAILALGPLALILIPAGRPRLLLVAPLIALFVTLPMAIGDQDRFRTVVRSVGELGSQAGTVTPPNLLFPLASEASFVQPVKFPDGRMGFIRDVGYRLSRAIARAARASVLALAAVLTLLCLRRRRRPEDAVLLFAAIMLGRTLLDPANHSYYLAPVLAALLAYEVLRNRPPLATVGVSIGIYATDLLRHQTRDDWALFAFYCAWTLAATAWIVAVLLGARWRRDSLAANGATAPEHRTP